MTTDKIVNWLAEQNRTRNGNGFVIDFTKPSVASALAIHCASNTKKGCTIITLKNLTDLVENLGPKDSCIDVSVSHDLSSTFATMEHAYKYNKLIVQSFDATEMQLLRPWSARFGLMSDVLLFSSMLNTDIKALYASVADMESKATKHLFELEARDQYSKDIPLSMIDIEWAFKTNRDQPRFKGIITDNTDPAQHKMWPMLTSGQKKIIAFLHQRHKLTNYKTLKAAEYK